MVDSIDSFYPSDCENFIYLEGIDNNDLSSITNILVKKVVFIIAPLFLNLMTVRLIDIAKPFLPILPEVEIPFEKAAFDDKVVYTIFAGLIYLFAQFPLVAISKNTPPTVDDPIYFLRGVFGAEPKTLLEFGVFPIVSSGLIMQLLAGMRIIKVNFKLQKDRELFQAFTKILILFQFSVLANIFVYSGYYGDNLTVTQAVLLNLQLIGTGFVVTLMTEVVDKGFGFASGNMVILTIAIATNLVADAFGLSQIQIDAEGHKEAQGSIINLFQGLRAEHRSFIGNLASAFNRDYLPNLNTTVLMLVIGAVIAYVHSIRIELPIRSTKARGMNNVYPIRLLHVGCLPIMFSYVILTYVHIFAFVLIQVIAKNDPSHIICRVLGHYESVNNLLADPTFPLSMLTPPRSFFSGILQRPLTYIVFTAFMLVTAIFFASKWQEISGSSARDLAQEFKEQGITLVGRREQNIAVELNKVIPVASVTGAAILALVAVAGELLGLKGKGAAMVMGVAGGFSLLELITFEYQQSGGNSALAQVLGPVANF